MRRSPREFLRTPRAPVEKALAAGKDVLFDIDWQGTRAALAHRGDAARPRARLRAAAESARARRGWSAAPRTRRRRSRGGSRMRARDRASGPSTTMSSSTRISTGPFRRRARSWRPSACGASASSGLAGFVDGLLKEADEAIGAEAQRDPLVSDARDRERPRPEAPPRGASARCRRLRSTGTGSGQSCFRLDRSIFRRWPNAAAVTASTAGTGRRSASARGSRRTTRGNDLRRRREGARRHVEQEFRPRPPLREHGQPAVGLRSGRRDDALRHLALEHQREARPPGRPRLGGEPADEERRRDVVGKVGDDPERPPPASVA